MLSGMQLPTTLEIADKMTDIEKALNYNIKDDDIDTVSFALISL